MPQPNLLVDAGFLPKEDLEHGLEELKSIEEGDEDEDESIVAAVKIKPGSR